MARGRKQQLYWDKVNKVYFQYIVKNGKRKKVYLCAARSRTNHPEARSQALKKWREIQEREGLTPYQVRKRRDAKKDSLDKSRDHRNRRPVDTVVGIIDHFLDFHFKRFEGNHIAESTYINLRSNTTYFKKWLASKVYDQPSDKSGGPKSILTKERLVFFWEHLTNRVSDGRMKKTYASGLLKTAKELYRWGFDQEPKLVAYNVPNTWLKIKTKRTDDITPSFSYANIKTFEMADVHYALTRRSNHPVGLYGLLGLNCGFTSIDIATLKLGHIQFDSKGRPVRIEKMRIKTRVLASWRLFESTSKVLAAYIAKYDIKGDDSLIFLDREGRPVVREMLNPEGKPSHKYDGVGRAFSRMKLARGLTFRHLRKTTATMMSQNTEGKYPLLEQGFLAHRPSRISLLHYVNVDASFMDTHLLLVEQQLELESLVPKIIENIKQSKLSIVNHHS